MAVNFGGHDYAEDEYIDMEVGSYSNIFCQSICSPPHQREFEFHMSANSLQKPTTTSPADELFYQGKLLPLHLPPRLQMVKKLLENTDSAYDSRADTFEEVYSTPLMTTATTPTATSTPFESCNISPAESCRVSRELNLEEYFLECSTAASGFVGESTKKSWTKKLRLMKQSSSLGSKLKASRAYLKSWFGKSSADSCKGAARVADEGTASKADESLYNHVKAAKKAPFGQIHRDKYGMGTVATSNINKQKISDGGTGRLHRRSFSMAIKRNLTSKSPLSSSSSSSASSSSSTNSSNGFHRLPFLKKSSSTNSEMENPIQGAIAHCKQSQQLFLSRKTSSHEVGLHTLSAPKKKESYHTSNPHVI